MRAALALALVALATTPTRADDRITDDTPYKVPEGKWRAGLWKLQYGVHGVPGLELGTYMLPYASWALDVRSANAQVKYRFLQRGRWTLSGQLGLAYVDFAGLDVDAKIVIVPVTVLAAVRLSQRFTLGFGIMYTRLWGEGSYNEDEMTELNGAVAVDNAQSWFSLMMKISRGWTMYLESRGISSTEGAARGNARHALDERTTVDVMLTGKASIDELQGASTLLAMQWSREKFRLRLGVGWGNFNIPVVNFIVPVAIPYPEIDVFWVF